MYTVTTYYRTRSRITRYSGNSRHRANTAYKRACKGKAVRVMMHADGNWMMTMERIKPQLFI